MRISDWSSDVCSSDLRSEQVDVDAGQFGGAPPAALVPPSVRIVHRTTYDILADLGFDLKRGNGRADAHARSVGDLAIAGIVGMHQQRRLFRANKPLDIVHPTVQRTEFAAAEEDRTRVVEGKSVSVRLDVGDGRIIKN